MQNTLRLTFLNSKTNDELHELWVKNYEGAENQHHIHAFVARQYQVPNERALSWFLQNQPTSWLIKRRDSNDIIGYIIFGDLGSLINNVGFTIGLEFSRKGYASEALLELINYLRLKGIKEAFGYCLETNIGSIRTKEKCGFENLGRTGESYGGFYQLKFGIKI
jgi:RimJ/RimL family protein N-acetyltransferase